MACLDCRSALLANDTEQYPITCPMTTIGAQGCSINIDGDGVEAVHATIVYNAVCGTFNIMDMFTLAGTRVNQYCLGNCFRQLNNGDVIQFGRRKRPLTFLLSPPSQDPCIPVEDIIVSSSGLTHFELQKKHEEIIDQKLQMLDCLDEKSKSILKLSKENSKILTSKTSKQTQNSAKGSQENQGNQQQEAENEPICIQNAPCLSNILSPKTQQPVISDKNVRKIKQVLKEMEEKTTNKELLLQLEELRVESHELMCLINSLNTALFCKDDTIKLLNNCVCNLKCENENLEIQNGALLDSASRRYWDCEGFRQEDLIIKKDMEMMKIKLQLQMKTESVDELKKCVDCMKCCIEKLKKDNKQLQMCVKELAEEAEKSKEKMQSVERSYLLSRVSSEKLNKQLDLLKQPLLDMINVVCENDDENQRKIEDFKEICMVGYIPPTTRESSENETGQDTESKKAKGKKPKEEVKTTKITDKDKNKEKACLEAENEQVGSLMANENFIKTVAECVAKLKMSKGKENPKREKKLEKIKK